MNGKSNRRSFGPSQADWLKGPSRISGIEARSLYPTQADWVANQSKTYNANLSALSKTFLIIRQAVHELTCMATGRNEPFKEEEWRGSVEDYFRAATPAAVQWRKPRGTDTGERTNIFHQPEFTPNPLLAPYFLMLQKGRLARVDVPGSFGQFHVVRNGNGEMKTRRLRWDNPEDADRLCLVAEAIQLRLTKENPPLRFRVGEPIEVSARSTLKLAAQALHRPHA